MWAAELSDWISLVERFGVFGLIALAFITGKIVAGYQYDRMEKRAEAAEKREQDMHARYEQQIPLIAAITQSGQDLAELVADLRADRDRLRRELRDQRQP